MTICLTLLSRRLKISTMTRTQRELQIQRSSHESSLRIPSSDMLIRNGSTLQCWAHKQRGLFKTHVQQFGFWRKLRNKNAALCCDVFNLSLNGSDFYIPKLHSEWFQTIDMFVLHLSSRLAILKTFPERSPFNTNKCTYWSFFFALYS